MANFRGKWHKSGLLILDENNRLVADTRMHEDNDLFRGNMDVAGEELENVACLISAAPDMRNALKRMIEALTFRGLQGTNPLIAKIYMESKKALAKAEGK